MDKKRHHYIPKSYLKFFCDDAGQLLVYRKDDPCNVIRLSPNNTGFHKYYYSQPRPDGTKEHNALEDCFSKIEEKWPGIVDRLHRRENVNDSLDDIIQFMALQRARVPASRDAAERIEAERTLAAVRRLDAAGELPPKPEGFEDILDHVEVSINPHQSIHAMVSIVQGSGQVFDRIGFGVLHNRTEIPFLTSDNPVIWFDPSVQDSDLQPYVLRPDGSIVLLFPISPSLVIYGGYAYASPVRVRGIGDSRSDGYRLSRGDQSASLSFRVSDYLCTKGGAGTTYTSTCGVVSHYTFRPNCHRKRRDHPLPDGVRKARAKAKVGRQLREI